MDSRYNHVTRAIDSIEAERSAGPLMDLGKEDLRFTFVKVKASIFLHPHPYIFGTRDDSDEIGSELSLRS